MDNPKVLIVDDEKSICEVLKKFLEKKGYDVITANDGNMGLKVARENRIDVVICDIKMPGIDGIQVVKGIKKIDQRIPVLINTAYPDMDTAIEALKSGAYDYLVKPVNLEEIGEKVSRALSSRRVLEENVLFSKIVSLHEVSRYLSAIHDFDKLLKMVLEYSIMMAKADSGALMLLDEQNELKVITTMGVERNVEFNEKDRMKIASWVAKNEEPILIDKNSPTLPFLGKLKWKCIGSSVTFPLKTPNRKIGVLHINRARESESFTNIELEIINVLASHAAISIDNVKVYDKIQEQYLQTMKAFAQAVEAKDFYTRGHSEKVMEYSLKLAIKMGLKAEELEVVKHAGLLHDIGKIGVPEQILNKPGKLTPVEFEEIRKHPTAGVNIIAGIASMKPLLPLVHHHHESYNGRGYPEGLKGNEIPLGARILAVTDSYDAMTSSRTYRKRMDESIALSIIREELGKQFDADIGRLFIELIEEEQCLIKKK